MKSKKLRRAEEVNKGPTPLYSLWVQPRLINYVLILTFKKTLYVIPLFLI